MDSEGRGFSNGAARGRGGSMQLTTAHPVLGTPLARRVLFLTLASRRTAAQSVGLAVWSIPRAIVGFTGGAHESNTGGFQQGIARWIVGVTDPVGPMEGLVVIPLGTAGSVVHHMHWGSSRDSRSSRSSRGTHTATAVVVVVGPAVVAETVVAPVIVAVVAAGSAVADTTLIIVVPIATLAFVAVLTVAVGAVVITEAANAGPAITIVMTLIAVHLVIRTMAVSLTDIVVAVVTVVMIVPATAVAGMVVARVAAPVVVVIATVVPAAFVPCCPLAHMIALTVTVARKITAAHPVLKELGCRCGCRRRQFDVTLVVRDCPASSRGDATWAK